MYHRVQGRSLTDAMSASTSRDKSVRNGAVEQIFHLSSPCFLLSPCSYRSPNELPCTKDIIRCHVDAYFEYVYPITTHGFLHQGTLLQELDEERASVVLLKAITVSASHFVASTAEVSRVIARWAEDVDLYITNNMGVFSFLNLQIIILWMNHHYCIGNLGKTWMLVGLAARLAYCLQVNVEARAGSPSDRGSAGRRMLWNIHIMDRLLAGPVAEFSVCSKFIENLKLPCDEYFYLADIAVETDTAAGFGRDTQIANIGTFASLVGLLDIWLEILL